MTTERPSKDWEDSIDLRKWLDALVRRWWLIAAVVAASIAVAAIYGYGFQASVYESSGGSTLPLGSNENGIGLAPLGYQEFASSTPVIESVRDKLGLEQSAGQLRNHYSFQVNESNFISVRATAGSAELAFQLTSAWIEAYGQQIQAHLQQEFAERKSNLVEETDLLLAELTSAREVLTEFNLENPASSMNSQLAELEAELSRRSQRLRELTMNLIPSSEARLESLEAFITEEASTFGGGGTPGTTDSLSPGRSAFAPVEESNASPAYYELTQSLMSSQLSNLESDLVDSESSLRQLVLTDIPVTEARLASLKKTQSDEPEFLTGSSSIGASTGSPVPNPVHIGLSEDIAATEVQLETAKKEAEILEKKVVVLQQRISEMRSEIVLHQGLSEELRLQADTRKEIRDTETELAARRKEVTSLEVFIPQLEAEIIRVRRDILASDATRRELEAEVADVSEEYNLAKSELTNLTALEPGLTSLSSLSTIREPAVPAAPVSPNRARNMGLAAFLGFLAGVAVVLAWEFYRAQPLSSR